MLGYYLANLARHGRIDPLEYYPCPRYRVVYVENAKVACTAIKQLLYPETSYEALGQEAFHHALHAEARHRPPRGTEDFLYFSVFRDPVARLFSCYKDKIAGAAAHGRPGIFHTRFHRAVHGLFGGTDPARPGLSFDAFAQAVAAVPDCLRDRHTMSQAPIRAAVLGAAHGFAGRYEHLAEDWATLAARTGLPPLPALNQSHKSPCDAPELSDRGRDALAHAFVADFALLGYPLPTTAVPEAGA